MPSVTPTTTLDSLLLAATAAAKLAENDLFHSPFEWLNRHTCAPSFTITDLIIDSRKAAPGSLFVALRGAHSDGHSYIDQARAVGAAVVVDHAFADAHPHLLGDSPNLPIVVVSDTRQMLPFLANAWANNPSQDLRIIAVTGTNGKTTTAHLIEEFLQPRSVGIFGTIAHRWPGHRENAINTTPESITLQKSLRLMLDSGVSDVVLEASSHALAGSRLDTLLVDVAVFTNLTQDHLDFHQSMASYQKAKERLFRDFLDQAKKAGKSPVAVISADDPAHTAFVEAARFAPATVWTYSTQSDNAPDADLVASDIQADAKRTSFTLTSRLNANRCPEVLGRFDIPLIGNFNVSNVLAALAATHAAGCPLLQLLPRLHTLHQVPGRLQRIGDRCFVDYAHAPDAVASILKTLRRVHSGRIGIVLGAGGDRDTTKREAMGRIAAEGADLLIITNDNPRTENPNHITKEILRGARSASSPHCHILIDTDRRRAIETAVALTGPNDLLVVAGKGHETYQEIGRRRISFSDVDVLTHALAKNDISTQKNASLVEKSIENNPPHSILSTFSTSEILSIVDGSWQLRPDTSPYQQQLLEVMRFLGASTDTRTTQPGDLFVALRGPTFDGHSFLESAAEAGAVAALVSVPVANAPLPQLLVSDTLFAFQQIASAVWRRASDAGMRTITLTGSNGKTTTKELLANILSTQAPVHKTPGNFNNHIGVPITLCSLDSTAKIAVIELGANDFGEIDTLTRLCPGDVRVIVSIGDAHLEHFHDRKGVCRAKSEIANGADSSTQYVVPAEYLEQLIPPKFPGAVVAVEQVEYADKRNNIKDLDNIRWLTYEEVLEANDFIPNEQNDLNDHFGISAIKWSTSPGSPFSGQLPLPPVGACADHNLAIALAVWTALDLPWDPGVEEILRCKLAAWTSLPMGRAETHHFATDAGVLTVVNDAYNANPTSVIQSVTYFGRKADSMRAIHTQMLPPSSSRLSSPTPFQKTAVIGQMNELGEQSLHLHQEVARQLALSGAFDQFIWTGQFAGPMASAAREIAPSTSHHEVVDPMSLVTHLPNNGFVLLKASRTLHLENTVEALNQLYSPLK